MESLNQVWDCVLLFIFMFNNLFFFHVVSTRNAYRTVAKNALVGSDKVEGEKFPRSPFEIDIEEEGELNVEEEDEEDSQKSELDKMKEALSKMEEK